MMKIDRERFLLLAAALTTGVCATPGCSSAQTLPAEDPQRAESTGGTCAKAPAQPIVVLVPAAFPSTPSATATSAEPRTSPPVVLAAPSGGSTSTRPTPTAATAKPPNPYDGTPVTAQRCNPAQNREGSPPACTLSAPGPTCESFQETKKECPTLNQLLKPRVATAAIECLRRRSGTREICEFNVSSICAYEALGSACLDPAAKAACNGVMARCGAGPRGNYNKMTRESCEAGVSGIVDSKRRKFISCITEMCRFETCLTYL